MSTCEPILVNWCTRTPPPRMAQSPTSTCPPRVDRLDIITLSPTIQSCATWVDAISKQSEPTLVSPSSFVPRLMVTYSLILVRLPIKVFVLSPPNFKS